MLKFFLYFIYTKYQFYGKRDKSVREFNVSINIKTSAKKRKKKH